MPKLIDRAANAARVHPLVMQILADEGPAAVSYRRVATESGLTLAAVRNMWQTQEKLVQRGGAHAAGLLPTRMFLPGPAADPLAALREGMRRLLPLEGDQRTAHRAVTALRQAPAGSAGRVVAESHDRLLRLRTSELVDQVGWLQTPSPRASYGTTATGMIERSRQEPTGSWLAVHVVVTGLADALARPGSTLSTEQAEACLQVFDLSLLD